MAANYRHTSLLQRGILCCNRMFRATGRKDTTCYKRSGCLTVVVVVVFVVVVVRAVVVEGGY